VPTGLLSSLVMFYRHGSSHSGRRTLRGTASGSFEPRSMCSAPPVRLCLSYTTPAGPALQESPRGLGGGLSFFEPGTAVLFLTRWKAYGCTARVSIAAGLPATSRPTVSRTGVSNVALTWLGKLRPCAVHVNLSRYPRRLSRGNCRVPRQPSRPVAGTSAFLFA